MIPATHGGGRPWGMSSSIDAAAKLRMALSLLAGVRTLAESARELGVDPDQVTAWRDEVIAALDAIDPGPAEDSHDDEPSLIEILERLREVEQSVRRSCESLEALIDRPARTTSPPWHDGD